MTVSDRDDMARRFGGLLSQKGDTEIDLCSLRAMVVSMTVQGPLRRLRKTHAKVAVLTGVGLAAACAFLLLYLGSPKSDLLEFTVDDSGASAKEGLWLRTRPNEQTAIRFLGGTLFEFVERTEARVVEAREDRVTIDLEQGKVMAEVAPRLARRWSVRAGPYAVSVVGTVFSVAWSKDSSELMVSVERGKVLVQGPGLEGEGLLLAAGRSLRADASIGRVTFEPTSLATKREELEDDQGSAGPEHLPKPENEASSSSAKKNPVSSSRAQRNEQDPDWQSLARMKLYKESFSTARRQGALSMVSALDENDLWTLANVARYAREGGAAKNLLTTYRDRFPMASRSHTAAFLLGKSAIGTGDHLAARQWLETYLREAPSGPLAEEALGRLIDVYADLGLKSEARRTAKIYLESYDGGYFTRLARQAIDD